MRIFRRECGIVLPFTRKYFVEHRDHILRFQHQVIRGSERKHQHADKTALHRLFGGDGIAQTHAEYIRQILL